MSAITECTLTVGIADLQRAITSVVPHAEKQKQGDEQALLCRVRLCAGKDDLLVSASDGRTAAAAWVRITADDRTERFKKADGPFVVDLYPKQARQLAAACTPIREEGVDYGDATVHLTLGDVTITDVSGKYPLTSTTVPSIEQEATDTIPGTEAHGYPDPMRVFSAAMSRAAGVHKPMQPPPGAHGKFETAVREYETKAVWEPVGDAQDRMWVCWLRGAPRLGLLTAEQEARLELGGDLTDPGED